MDLEGGTRRYSAKVSEPTKLVLKPAMFQFRCEQRCCGCCCDCRWYWSLSENAEIFFFFCCRESRWRTVLTLAYQSLGVVYGDLSISPLYVFRSTFAEDIKHTESNDEVFGVLSLVFWTITLVPLVKYVFVVLKADDNGEGGTFALYSLLCRHARVSSLPNCQVADEELSEYKKDSGGAAPDRSFALRLKSTFEKHKVLQRVLLVLALIGTCMVIGDGILTPAISGEVNDCVIVL